MSKKEVVKEEAVEKEDLVAVEMTQDQKDEYVKFLRDKEETKKAKDEEAEEKTRGEELVRVRLVYDHVINKKKYHRGNSVEIPRRLLGYFQHAEQQARDAEISIHIGKERMYEVMQSGQAVLRSAKDG